MNDHIYTIKALQPDVLPESEYLPFYPTFRSQIAFFGKKTSQKQATATLQNSKTHASSKVNQILLTPTHRGSSPPMAVPRRTPSWWLPSGTTKVTQVKSP